MESFPVNFNRKGIKKVKMRKKTAMVLSLTVGILLFTSTALAEIAAKSGYDQAKDALKTTASGLTSKLSSYTLDMSVALKDNGNTIFSENSVNKYDVSKQACENTTVRIEGKNKNESSYYRDKSGYINFNSADGIYYVTEQNNKDGFWIRDPFKEKEAGDVEKIADALIGNLKDYVVVNQNPDGSKELSGTLNESQIPALINAVISLQLKQQAGVVYGNRENIIPNVSKDVFVKEIKGRMVVDKDGIIKSIIGTGIVQGKDDKGNEHSLSLEILGKVRDINSTTVKKPDLTGKKVQKNVNYNVDRMTKPQLYIGTYKNDIVIEKDDKLVKIGEKFVEITKMDDKSISGKYHETYVKGYEDYANKVKDFEFNSTFTNDRYNVEIDCEGALGNNSKGNMSLPPNTPNRIFLSLPLRNVNGIQDDTFYRVFE